MSITAEFTVQPAHQGAPGLAHGGVLATRLDETLGSLNWHPRRTLIATGRLETDFRGPCRRRCCTWAEVTAVAGRKDTPPPPDGSAAPTGPWPSRADTLFIEVKIDRFVDHGREEEIRAAMDDPDQIRRTRLRG